MKHIGDNCMVGSSLEEVKQLVDQVVTPAVNSSNQNEESSTIRKEKSELEKFLEEIPATDSCINRNSYNKNEYRICDKRGQIIDYFIVCGDKYDPITVNSGEIVEIYLKVKYFQNIKSPIYGFTIKTLDGIMIYGSNTRFVKTNVSSPNQEDVYVFKFRIKLNVQHGDIFIDLGVAEKLPSLDAPIDVRYDLIHLVIQGKKQFTGFVELESSSLEITRIEKI